MEKGKKNWSEVGCLRRRGCCRAPPRGARREEAVQRRPRRRIAAGTRHEPPPPFRCRVSGESERRGERGATGLLLEIAMGQADPPDGPSPIHIRWSPACHSRLVKHPEGRTARPNRSCPKTSKETAQSPRSPFALRRTGGRVARRQWRRCSVRSSGYSKRRRRGRSFWISATISSGRSSCGSASPPTSSAPPPHASHSAASSPNPPSSAVTAPSILRYSSASSTPEPNCSSRPRRPTPTLLPPALSPAPRASPPRTGSLAST